MKLPRNVDINRLAKEVEEAGQDKQRRIFTSIPDKRQLKDREKVLYYDGTDLMILVRYGDNLFTGAALTKL